MIEGTRDRAIERVLQAGAAYFGALFALGFVLGTIRVLAVAPRLGELGAVALELPIMLLASWFACAWAVRRWSVPAATGARVLMGAWAFALLLGAETALGTIGFGRSHDPGSRHRDPRRFRGTLVIRW